MTKPSDLIDELKYEVVKLRTGTEIVGMVRETPKGLKVTLPMICQLSITTTKTTLATFFPYAPLSSDAILSVDYGDVMHRNEMNKQFIPFYDEASSKWLSMVETGSIPLTNTLPKQEEIRKTIDSLVSTFTDEQLDAMEAEYDNVSDEDVRLYEEAIKEKIIH
jgi:hypothetical protein|tara:strand:+ start:4243 stop:4731 length:489 start_codon:yes stop_codon:yes gene_type:complete